MHPIPFNKPSISGPEFEYIRDALDGGQLSGNGPYTQRCQALLETELGVKKSLLTHSCTHALEMTSLLMNIEPGDEVIMPSYTFVSTANAFVLRGAIPVFIDIRPDTLNLDETLIEAAITARTKAIVPVHYAGVACEMDDIMRIARTHGLTVVEDAAHAIQSHYRGRHLGSIGQFGTLSFHETKNVICGEGGALLINDSTYNERAEILWQKGTNRSQFVRGTVDKYTWVDVGSSYLPGELNAAFLQAQLESTKDITNKRLNIWNEYHRSFEALEQRGWVRRPIVPDHCDHSAHLYYLLVRDNAARTEVLRTLNALGIGAVFHYVPLHSSPGGLRYGRANGELAVTDHASDCLLRLPLWPGLPNEDICFVINSVHDALEAIYT
jgi:dTDP-4-amino-4,6-dideoxygalactose transaminase